MKSTIMKSAPKQDTPMNRLVFATAFAMVVLLGACALPSGPQKAAATYDFGPGPAVVASPPGPARPTLAFNDVQAPAWLDGSTIFYRLAYSDVQQLRPYAQNRWTKPPAQLFAQRVRMRLARSMDVVAVGDTTAGATLKLELEDFSQFFETAETSRAQLQLRATVIQNGKLLGQRSFAVTRPAASANAAGGVRALTAAADAAIEELALWLPKLLRSAT